MASQHPQVVTGGPGRVLYAVVAVLLGWFVARHSQTGVRLLWLAATILAARCMFEAVLCPYYLVPPLLVALVLASQGSGKRFGAAVATAGGVSVVAYFFLEPWVWWLAVTFGLAAVLAIAVPASESAAREAGELTHGPSATLEPIP